MTWWILREKNCGRTHEGLLLVSWDAVNFRSWSSFKPRVFSLTVFQVSITESLLLIHTLAANKQKQAQFRSWTNLFRELNSSSKIQLHPKVSIKPRFFYIKDSWYFQFKHTEFHDLHKFPPKHILPQDQYYFILIPFQVSRELITEKTLTYPMKI